MWAGTVNLTSTIEVTVTAAASQSLTARIIEAVENAQSSKSPVQRFVDKFAAVYTPIVFVVALCVAIVPPLFLGDWLGWLYKALCLLVIACPCALVISTPVTIVSALATATRCGLLIKGGLFLEEARKLTNIGLDKTGTLTKGEPEVAGITLLGGADRKQVLSLAASLGAMNKHPLSAAIVREARRNTLRFSRWLISRHSRAKASPAASERDVHHSLTSRRLISAGSLRMRSPTPSIEPAKTACRA